MNEITTEIQVNRFVQADEQGVIDVILSIQREEFGIPIAIEDQPDLQSIPEFYQVGRGDFWVAKAEDKVIGTIGLKDIGAGQAALRKMFVAAAYRGRAFGVASRLLDRLVAGAEERGVTDIFLGTTDKFLAAHRFYEKSRFVEIKASDLPATFPMMVVDTKFYALQLARSSTHGWSEDG